jgi:hypothetical protein
VVTTRRPRSKFPVLLGEEPSSRKPHAGICAGLLGNWQSYRDGREDPLKEFTRREQMSEAIDESLEEKEARRFFEEGLGLMVRRVPSATSKTPDFLIDGEKPGYVLEVKSRFDDESFLKELERGSTAVRSRSLGHDRWAADSARAARKQLIGGDPSRERFWVLWFAVECLSSTEEMFNQVIGTLYGIRQVAYWDEATQTMDGRECLFVVPGVFERWPDIDGAIVTVGDTITLCANEFSDKAERFQSSLLYQSFAQHGGPVSPSVLERRHGFLSIADRTIDRTSEEAVRRYLSQEYNLKHVQILNIKAHSASVVVPSQ